MFSPQFITSISNEERDHLYTQTQEYDLLNTSYITDGEGEYDFS